MTRLAILIAALVLAAGPAVAAPHLVRVVIVQRHGIRPPTQSNDALAKYADQPWPAWPVAPGLLTPHGAETVKLVGESVAAAYRRAGLLPAGGCAPAGQVSVWADNADQRTKDTGQDFADALQPGCGLTAHWSPATPRDPIFSGTNQAACAIDADKAKAVANALAASHPTDLSAPTARLQSILAPHACQGGAGTCLTASPAPSSGVIPVTSSLAEDLLLEYVDGKPMSQVGWGRASRADIIQVMAIHERAFGLIQGNTYVADRRAALMTRIILAALAGQPVSGGPQSGPDTHLLVLSGHDTNLAWMAGVFGLDWKFPDNPDATAPSTSLAFELWAAGGRQYVRPVLYYAALDQLRTLTPGQARTLPLKFADCASGPMGSCPVDTLRQRILAELPGDCGVL
ncbi:MAG TPA: histidine-type phosphatase [Caulobacteraceae bacterium]|nr:histidine-type phosphatase [Caulobacteraceae bacterium]